MATVETVASVIAEFPEVTMGERHRHQTWFVGGKAFAWHRPFSKADLKRFGTEAPPSGPILAVTVADLGEKEAVLGSTSAAVFTIEHFDRYPAVLVQLEAVPYDELCQLLTDAWLAVAPREIADEYARRVGLLSDDT